MLERSSGPDVKNLVVVRGGGDIASGTILKLHRCGFSVLVLETQQPSAIRRNVAFCEAVYQGSQRVEDAECFLAQDAAQAADMLREGRIAMLVDPGCRCLESLKPLALVDGILAKRNLGTCREMAPVTVAIGPGFTAGQDVDAVVESMRGHALGRVIYRGSAAPNTGIPGRIAGADRERVIHSPADGRIRAVRHITDTVCRGETIAYIDGPGEAVPVKATLDGLLRGLIRDGYPVVKGFKIADIDPRTDEYENCFTVSDKARCIAGGVLEAILHLKKERGL